MTLFGSFFRSKKAVDTLTAQELRDTLQFANGYLLAMSQGVAGLEQKVLDQAAERMLSQLEDTIVRRAEVAGHMQVRTVLDLQKKAADFTQKLSGATTDAERAKYTNYLEAINWMLIPNGH